MMKTSVKTNVQRVNVRTMTMIALMTAVICILGPLTMPIGPVPITFTNFAICLAAYLLGWKHGTVSCLLYLLIGMVGIPVFSGFSAGPAKLLGPTGGYFIGYLFLAFFTGLFADKFRGKKILCALGMVIGTILLYGFGTVWLAYQAGMGFAAALGAGVIPFMPGDIIKIILAVTIGSAVNNNMLMNRSW